MRRVALGLLALALVAPGCTRDNPAFGLDGGGGSEGAPTSGDDDDDDDSQSSNSQGDDDDDDDDDTADDDDDTADDDDDDDDDNACPPSQTCLPTPGEPWDGPVVLWTAVGVDPKLPSCRAGDYPDLIETGFINGFMLPGNFCCYCEDPPTACSDPDLIEYGNAKCRVGGSDVPWNPECTPFAAEAGVGYEISSSFPITGACEAVPTLNLPPPVTGGRGRICGGPNAGAPCSNGACIDEAPDGAFGPCVVAPGHQDTCPRGYPDRHDLFALDDQRECQPGACGCGGSFGGECEASLIVHANEGCGAEVDVYGEEECAELAAGGEVGSLSAYTEVLEPGQCNEVNAAPMGDVFVIDIATVCCR